MKSLIKDYAINAPIEKVWDALVNTKEIAGWDGGPAVMNDKEGTKFKLWGGDIWGTNRMVEKEKLLVQDWYGGKWDEPSIVEFHLERVNENKTQLTLKHSNIPNAEEKDIDEGWDNYYLAPLKNYLEGKK